MALIPLTQTLIRDKVEKQIGDTRFMQPALLIPRTNTSIVGL